MELSLTIALLQIDLPSQFTTILDLPTSIKKIANATNARLLESQTYKDLLS